MGSVRLRGVIEWYEEIVASTACASRGRWLVRFDQAQ